MYELKQGTQQKVLVLLVDANGTPVTSVADTSMSGAYWRADGTVGALTITGNWNELTFGSWGGSGVYELVLPASVLSAPGPFGFTLAHSGSAKRYNGQVKVVANEEADTKAVADELRADYTTARAAKLDNITVIGEVVTLLQKYQEGRWKIHKSGADANRMVFYDVDGVTPLKKFDLLTLDGVATYTNAGERVPV